MIPHRQTLISMDWPQPKSPIQTDNSTAVVVTNKTIVPRWAKMMDIRFWWLHCCASQDQFCYYWDTGSKTWADYHTKLQYPSPLCRLEWAFTHVIGLHIELTILGEYDVVSMFILGLGWEFQFLVPISGTPIISRILIPFSIPKIPVGFLF